ncbi:MAG: site-specific integrase [Clostridiales bacterium]|nr:site-specific integrase [Clostridiales bacterium]
MNSPRWDGRRWIVQEQKDGKRHTFTSSVPGAKGRKEAIKKYEKWYFGEASGEKSVNTVSREFLDDVKARRGEDSEAFTQYERYIRLYIAPVVGQKKICKVTLREWQSLINEARGRNKPLSEKSLKSLRGIIMQIIRFGYEDYQCDLLRGKLYIPKGHFKKEKEVLQKNDVRRLLEPSELWYYNLFVFLLVTGMRPGEALGLRLSDIDFNSSSVTIRRAVNARGQITDGKNENARRMIPIDGLASSILRKTIRRNQEKNLRTEWIFCSPDGSKGNQSTMRNHWKILKDERQLPGTVYSLRHTFITMMKNVMPEQMIKDICGHSISMDTFGTYGHITDNESREAAQIINLTFGQNLDALLDADESANDGH